jgi:uncharacterized protein YjeT (DUF2065 family)
LILSNAILAVGLLFVIEGILVALAPVYLEKILKVLVKASYESRRLIGLITLAWYFSDLDFTGH